MAIVKSIITIALVITLTACMSLHERYHRDVAAWNASHPNATPYERDQYARWLAERYDAYALQRSAILGNAGTQMMLRHSYYPAPNTSICRNQNGALVCD